MKSWCLRQDNKLIVDEMCISPSCVSDVESQILKRFYILVPFGTSCELQMCFQDAGLRGSLASTFLVVSLHSFEGAFGSDEKLGDD